LTQIFLVFGPLAKAIIHRYRNVRGNFSSNFFFDFFHHFIEVTVSYAHYKGFGRGNINKNPNQNICVERLCCSPLPITHGVGRWIKQRHWV